MKRAISILSILALMLPLLLCAAPAHAVFDVPDDMYQMPEMLEADESWMLFDADDASTKLSCNQNAEIVELDNGSALVLRANNDGGVIEFKAQHLGNRPLCIEGYDYSELALRLRFYVSDPTVFQSNCEMELTSGGTCDKLEVNFSPTKLLGLTKGWNNLYLPFSEGGVKNGQLDVTNINYMRFYFFLKDDVTMAFDDVMIVPLTELSLHETFSSAAADRWTANVGQVASADGALTWQLNGSGSLSTDDYSLPIFNPLRTPIRFCLKASAPDAIRSISLRLTDANGSHATATLDPKQLTAGFPTEYTVLCPDMDAAWDYSFELTEELALMVTTDAEVVLTLDDLSVVAYDTDYYYDWVDDYKSEPGEYSIAVIPDIQELSAKYPHKLNTIMQWMADNKEKENILFAIDLGDVTWNGHTGDTTSSNNEFENARQAFDILTEAGIDYSIAYGNHDYTPTGRDTAMFNQYFPLELFASFDSYGGSMSEEVSDNTYFTFRGGNTDYLVLAIEYNPSNAAIAWADEIVTAHPDHKVIVTTHGYLQGDSAANVKDENALAPAVGADRLWNNLLKKHENILMLLCGHAWSKSYSGDLVMRQDQGDHGNTVYQIMANAQDIDDTRGGVGMLLMMRFSEDGSVIDFNWFSPVSHDYAFREKNQFKLALNNELSVEGIEADASYCGERTVTIRSKTSVTVKFGSHELAGNDGVYTLPATGRRQTLTILDPFGDQLASYPVTIHEGHTGGTASCTERAVCTICGEHYGELLAHQYGEDGKCVVCGASASEDTTDDHEDTFPVSPVLLIPIAAAVAVAGVCVVLAVRTSAKRKS